MLQVSDLNKRTFAKKGSKTVRVKLNNEYFKNVNSMQKNLIQSSTEEDVDLNTSNEVDDPFSLKTFEETCKIGTTKALL